MKNKIQIKYLWLLAIVVMMMSGCPDSTTTADSGAITTWTFSVVTGNWTTAPPWTSYRYTLDDTGNLTWATVEEGETDTVVSEGSATISGGDMELFCQKAATVDLMNQASLNPAGDCAGGGSHRYTYTVDGRGSNEFTISTGCDADLAALDADLAALVDAFFSILNRYVTQQ
jgi:hypothetical protein